MRKLSIKLTSLSIQSQLKENVLVNDSIFIQSSIFLREDKAPCLEFILDGKEKFVSTKHYKATFIHSESRKQSIIVLYSKQNDEHQFWVELDGNSNQLVYLSTNSFEEIK